MTPLCHIYGIFTFFPAITSYFSTVTLVKALDSVAVSIEQMVIPIIIHNIENSRPVMDFGVLSPYLKWKILKLEILSG